MTITLLIDGVCLQTCTCSISPRTEPEDKKEEEEEEKKKKNQGLYIDQRNQAINFALRPRNLPKHDGY